MRKIIFTLLLGFIATSGTMYAQGLKANFSALESKRDIYKQGFDSAEGMTDWTVVSQNTKNTWKLGNSKKQGLPNFSSIDPESQYSATVPYDDNVNQNEQLISPVFTLTKPSLCKFYAAFDGGYAYFARLTVEVENQTTKDVVKIFDSFLWSNETGHERHKWLPFEFDLTEYIDQPIKFIFRYKGIGGDDVYIDDFRIQENDNSDQSKAYVYEGKSAHFEDESEGSPTSWQWTFPGGTPTTSIDQNPVVTYNKAGIYDVTLTVSDGSGNDQKVRTGYVHVLGVAPKSLFAFPEEGYLSPEAAIYLPINTEVTYKDNSENMPTTWQWTLPGTNVGTSTEQNPIVKYAAAGTYDAKLKVTNAQGTDENVFMQAVRVGGKCHIWNIHMEESGNIGEVQVSWYGFYGGSNWLDMPVFAEKFKKPIVKGKIHSVDIYYSRTKTVIEPVEVTVSIMKDNGGLPGEVLATTKLSSDELKYDSLTWVPTTFNFEEPVEVDDVFYIAVDGFPNRYDEVSKEKDEVVMGLVHRKITSPIESTAYHLLVDNNISTWVKSEDENISFAITPNFEFISGSISIDNEKLSDEIKPAVYFINGLINIDSEGKYDVDIYDISGKLLSQYKNVEKSVSAPITKGIYIIKLSQGANQWTYKIIR